MSDELQGRQDASSTRPVRLPRSDDPRAAEWHTALQSLNQEWRDETLAGAVQNLLDAWHKAWQPFTDTISDRLPRLFGGKR